MANKCYGIKSYFYLCSATVSTSRISFSDHDLVSMKHPSDRRTNKQIKLNPAGNLIIRKGVDIREQQSEFIIIGQIL